MHRLDTKPSTCSFDEGGIGLTTASPSTGVHADFPARTARNWPILDTAAVTGSREVSLRSPKSAKIDISPWLDHVRHKRVSWTDPRRLKIIEA